MASNKRSNLSPSIQPTEKVLEARQHLLAKMQAMQATLNAEIFRLQTTGEVVDAAFEKAYEGVAWAIEGLWEETELARDAAEFEAQEIIAAKRGNVRGFAGKAAA